MGEPRRRWRSAGLWLLVVLLVAGVAAPAPAARRARRHRHAPAPLKLSPLSTDQARLLAAQVVRVRVQARRASTVRLFAVSKPAGRAPVVVVSRTVTVRLRARRARVIALRLIATARAQLASCGGLEVRAILLAGRRRRPTRGFRAPLRLTRTGPSCRGRGPAGSGGRGGAGGFGTSFGVGENPRQGGAANPVTNPDQGTGKCDPNNADPAGPCLEPWPNDYFSVLDPSTDTGRRVNLDITSMPRNKANKPIDPTDINRNDGYSPGAPIVVRVPGMDTKQAFARTGAVPITDMARAFDDRQPVVVINTRTLERQLIWAEIDSNPSDPANVNLIIHPAVNLPENTRFIVALRDMRDASGKILAPSATFKALRDGTPTSDTATEGRRKHFEAMFAALAAAGIDRQSLYLAWDFTVASEKSLSERQLAIRNDAFKQLGDTNLADMKVDGHAPSFTITKVTNFTRAQNAKTARVVEGSYTVPCYLNLPNCPPGSRFLYPPGSTTGPPMPIPGNTMTARFTCNIPWVAMEQGGARPSLYGHGLFGSRGEVGQDQAQSMGQEHDFMYCATDWVGMACTDVNGPPGFDPANPAAFFNELVSRGTDPNTRNDPNCDIPNALAAESDLSNFPSLVDRVEQSFVNFMYLGRLMIHPDGFNKDINFQGNSGQGVIDTRRLFYDGNSQGGIFGGSLIALEPDLDRGVIGVPGMDYAVLLQRSSDFGTGQGPDPTNPGLPQYAYPLYQAYPNELERQLILSLMQQMWDHSDPNGLAAHMTTDPLPNTPVHHVLMQAALGDHQVSNYAAEAEARTIGARARLPWADPGRFTERDPTFGIPPITRYPYDGSAITLWDIGPVRPPSNNCDAENNQCGTDPPPTTNTPPSRGVDPHEAPRNAVAAREMKNAFMQIGGQVIDTCGARPCYAFHWTGP